MDTLLQVEDRSDQTSERNDRFGAALVALRPRLHGRAKFLAQDRAIADDLTQRTLERALECRDSFQGGTNLIAWLNSIMRNLFLDERRHEAMRRRLEQQAGQPTASDVQTGARDGSRSMEEREYSSNLSLDIIDFISIADVNAAVAALSAQSRRLFALAYEHRVPHREIAAELGIPVSTVGTRLLRLRRRIRRTVEHAFHAYSSAIEI